ncbi:tyrosine-type recombinase/integrase [Alteromonas mediterranea]|uniref:tyrosine-type recombinase/integrase n=1 Tax=Alteromonas mediterranea TaxID=314275 RepID=UPI0012F76FDB|nr:tyrosine-type recombinase/integrase [Alteromonas mediterranea]QGX63078.1 tyrosine-type recombinase/integrase [Alteromonas mediterranea]
MTKTLSLSQNDFALNNEHKIRVVENLTELRDSVWETMSFNTRKAYQSDFNQYLQFCRENKLPALASDWKITKRSCQAFFDRLMNTELKHHTIKRKLAAIRFFMGVSELPDPWKHSKLFNRYINGKLKEKPSIQKQAKPLKLHQVREASCVLDTDSLLGLRDAVLINLAIDTLFRASNILAIEVEHIDWQARTIFAPRSKNDQAGDGHFGFFSNETASLLKKWLEKAQISEGFIFRKLSPKQTVQEAPMQYQALLKRYEAIGVALNTEGKFTCHSTRTGGVLTLLEADVPMAEIVLSGNWKNETMAIRYAKQYQAGKTGMAKVR